MQFPPEGLGQGLAFGSRGGGTPPGPSQVGNQGHQPQGEAEADEQLQEEFEHGGGPHGRC